MPAKLRVSHFSTTVDVPVDIPAGDLSDAGWHHKSECGGFVPVGLAAVVTSLHRQAHPGESRDIALCREEPCRSLTIEQLRSVGG